MKPIESIESAHTHSVGRWSGAVFSVVSILAMSACAMDERSEGTDDFESSDVQDLSLNQDPPTTPPCMTLTQPAQNFNFATGAILLTVSGSCTAGPAEFQYWHKAFGAPNWSTPKSPNYTGDASTWTPPGPGHWCLTVVSRTIGSSVDYEARASAKCGFTH